MRSQNIAGCVFAAGFGTRLGPVTQKISKVALPFMGHPMGTYALTALHAAGIRDVCVNLHHKGQSVRNAFEPYRNAFDRFLYSEENDRILLTGGGFARMATILSDIKDYERYILCHGDVVSGANLKLALASHIASGAEITLVLSPRPAHCNQNVVVCDSQSRVVRIRDTKAPVVCDPTFDMLFTGIHIVEASFLKRLDNRPSCLVTEHYVNALAQGETIHATVAAEYFADLGTPAGYFASQRTLMAHPTLLTNPDAIRNAPLNLRAIRPTFRATDVSFPDNCDYDNVCATADTRMPALRDAMICRHGLFDASGHFAEQQHDRPL